MSAALQPSRASSSVGWWIVLAAVVGLAVLAALVVSDAQQAWFVPHEGKRVLLKLAIYWSLWVLWPLCAWGAWSVYQAWRIGQLGQATLSALLLLPCLCALWARFIEPSMVVVRDTPISSACGVRVALVSDLHVGLYVRSHDLNRLVDHLNQLDVDAVLIAGDLSYEPPRDLVATFAPLGRLRHRTLSVMGNHDEQKPGPPLTAPLASALAAAHVETIDGRRVTLGRCEIEGLGDLSSHSASRHLQAFASQPTGFASTHRVVLTHNPDTVFLLPQGYAGLVLAGHTHGGQINLPFITHRLLERVTEGAFERGLYGERNARVFVTSGTGTDKLPMRFRMPPTIDVLEL